MPPPSEPGFEGLIDATSNSSRGAVSVLTWQRSPGAVRRKTVISVAECFSADMTLKIPPLLILLRLLRMIDDENLHWTLLRFQFQPKLLLKSRENGRPRGVRWRWTSAALWFRAGSFKHRALVFIGCPLQSEIILASETRLILHLAAQLPRQKAY